MIANIPVYRTTMILNIVVLNSKIVGLLNNFLNRYDTVNEKSLNNFDRYLDIQEKIIEMQSKIQDDIKKLKTTR